MKRRHGFVANSSSSSYCMALSLEVWAAEWGGGRTHDDFPGFVIDERSRDCGHYGYGLESLSWTGWRIEPDGPLQFVATRHQSGAYLFGTMLQRWSVAWTCEGDTWPRAEGGKNNPPPMKGTHEWLQPVHSGGRSIAELVGFYERLAKHYGLEQYEIGLRIFSGE
jgi:hypothetical protein